MTAVYRRGASLWLSNNVLDTKGEGVAPTVGIFFGGFWGTKTRFLVPYKG